MRLLSQPFIINFDNTRNEDLPPVSYPLGKPVDAGIAWTTAKYQGDFWISGSVNIKVAGPAGGVAGVLYVDAADDICPEAITSKDFLPTGWAQLTSIVVGDVGSFITPQVLFDHMWFRFRWVPSASATGNTIQGVVKFTGRT